MGLSDLHICKPREDGFPSLGVSLYVFQYIDANIGIALVESRIIEKSKLMQKSILI
jgi:hypothetical protein